MLSTTLRSPSSSRSRPLKGLVGLAALGVACSLSPLARAEEPAEVAAEPAPAAAAPAAPVPFTAPAPVVQTVPFGAPAAAPVPAPVSAPATPTRAAPSSAPAEGEGEERPKPGQWYGYQTLAVDAGALALVAMSVRAESGEVALAALGTYVIGPPIVHFAHGNVAKGFGDLGLRVGLPVGGALVGAGLGCVLGGCAGGDFAGLAAAFGALVGGASGGVTAMILDWALLSREPGRQPRERKDARRWPVSLTPSLAVTPTGGAMGVGGVF
ncbi:MAG TPA: hypothetical protein PK141_12190 [Polyangiaceae bacterium]|nr:hypothetical protein [Polyangiaceae bacterium]